MNKPKEAVSRGILSENDLLRMLLPHWKFYLRNRKWESKQQKLKALKKLKKLKHDPDQLNSWHNNKFGKQLFESAAHAFEDKFNIKTVVISKLEDTTKDHIRKLKRKSYL